MRTVGITNQKGGSSKTTSAVNLAAALAEMGERVLVVDLDPQASASRWLGVVTTEKGLLDVLTDNGNLLDLVEKSSAAGVDVVPSSSWLANAEKALAGEVGAELVFRKALRKLPARWSFVLVDCPPALGLLTVSALAAVKELVVPVEAHVMALAGLAGLMQTVEVVRDRLNPELTVSAILACRVNARTRLSQEVVESLRESFPDLVLETVIRESVKVAEAPSFAQPITTYDPKGYGAEDYRAAAREIVQRRK